jgi:signal transduction histidine kinase
MTRTGGRKPFLRSSWGRLPLGAKILLPIFTLTLATALGAAVYFTFSNISDDVRLRAADGTAVALVVQGALEASPEDNASSYTDFLRRVNLAYPNVAAICVLSANPDDPLGQLVVYASSKSPAACDPASPLTPGLGILGVNSMARQLPAGNVEETALGTGLSSAGQSGVVQVLVHFTPVATLAWSTFSKAAVAGLMLALFQTGLVYLVLWFSALRPLTRLRLAALAAARTAQPSAFGTDTAIGTGGDEIHELSIRFDEMLTAVRDRERELVASHVQLETFMSSAPVIVFSATAEGKMLQLRGTGTEDVVKGLGRERIEDVTLLDMAGPNTELARLVRRACNGEKVHEVVSVGHWIGHDDPVQPAYLDVIMNPSFDSRRRLTGITGLAVNVSDRVDAASARAESQQKSAFLAAMSHELRTPLNSIMGFSQLLDLPGAKPELSPKQKRYVNHILSSGAHLLALVGDILDLAKVGSGQLAVELEAVPVHDLVMDPVDRIGVQALEKGLAIDVFLPSELIAYTDPQRVRQMLRNLLSNAVKFTPKDGGTILVSGRAVGGGVEISVADSGIGIAPEDQEKIFDEFTQVDRGPTRSLDGTGLGLTLTRRLAALVGGQIRVESAPGVGSTFTIWLPGMAGQGKPPELAPVAAVTAIAAI